MWVAQRSNRVFFANKAGYLRDIARYVLIVPFSGYYFIILLLSVALTPNFNLISEFYNYQ